MPGAAEPRAPGRWLNCGTVMAALGFLFFALFAVLLFQLLCAGPEVFGPPG